MTIHQSLSLAVGTEVEGGYRLVELLGRGGTGEVWRATGPSSDEVALKFVRLDRAPTMREESFLRFLSAEVQHPNLLSLYSHWQACGHLIIAMELADRTLMDRYNEAVGQGLAGIPLPELLHYMRQGAAAIDHLNLGGHDAPREALGTPAPGGADDFDLSQPSILHGDIKPQNLLLVGGQLKVGDFGLAKATEHSVTQHSGAHSPAYAAPEFLNEEARIGSDQYSLAVSYCQLRSGRLPFTGTSAQVITGHLTKLPDLSMLPEAERKAVERALAKEPRDRYPSCRAFVEALEAAAPEATPVLADPVPEMTGLCPVETQLEWGPAQLPPWPDTSPARGGMTSGKRRNGAFVLAAVALLLAISPLVRGFWSAPVPPKRADVPPHQDLAGELARALEREKLEQARQNMERVRRELQQAKEQSEKAARKAELDSRKAELDSRKTRETLEAARAALDKAESNARERAREAKADLDRAKQALEEARARAAVREALARMQSRMPISSPVTSGAPPPQLFSTAGVYTRGLGGVTIPATPRPAPAPPPAPPHFSSHSALPRVITPATVLGSRGRP